MSLPLIDFRGKITSETDAILEAEHLRTGKDRSEIARDWMHAIALQKIYASKDIERMLDRKGITVAEQGARGNSFFGDLTP